MSEMLKKLFEQRDAAAKAYSEFASPLIAENRSLTDDEESKRGELRGAVVRFDARIKEVQEDEARDAELAEARAAAGVTAPAVVTSEARTYGPGSPNSYFADQCWASMPGDPHFRDAQERLTRHGNEVVRDCVNDPEERKRVLGVARENFRKDESRARRFGDDLNSRALEIRAGMDTTAPSGGSFVTPQYLVSDYAKYREFGRVFIDETNKQSLPDYGMTVYMPVVQSPATVAVQAAQNTGISETDPTAGYLSSNLVTEAGQVTISQQLLDRAGPGVQFDKIVFEQLTMDYNRAIDAAVLVTAIANAGAVTDADVTAGKEIADFYRDVAQAASQMETTPGTIVSPTHLFTSPTEWNFLSSRLDTSGRPLVVPSYAGVMNAIAAAANGANTKAAPEGNTGYEVLGMSVFKDGSIPTIAGTPATTQILAAYMPEIWVWEGPLIPRTVPQTYAQNLSVLLQVYSYWTAIVRYPKAVQVITGARYPAAPSF